MRLDFLVYLILQARKNGTIDGWREYLHAEQKAAGISN